MINSQQVPIDVQQKDYSEDSSGKDRIIYLRKLYFLVLVKQMAVIWVLRLAKDDHSFSRCVLKYSGFTFWTCLTLIILIHMVGLIKRSLISKSPLRWIIYLLHTFFFAFFFTYLQSRYDDSFYIYYIFKIMTWVVAGLFLHAVWANNQLTFQSASLYIFGSVFTFTIWSEIFDSQALLFIYLISFAATVWGFFLVWEQETIAGVSNTSIVSKQDFVSGSVLVYVHLNLLGISFAENIRNLLIKARV